MKDITRILLIEDDASAAMIAQIGLEEAWNKKGLQAQITTCSDGLMAIDWLKRATILPHLILADIKMPKLDGLRFLRIIKEDERLRSIPVVMLTTSDSPQDINRAYDGQCAGYLLKSGNYDQFSGIMDILQNYWEASELP